MNADRTSPALPCTHWLKSLYEQGWLTTNDWSAWQSLQAQHAHHVFDAANNPPLIVGLFGGSGTGKSSLLNRLAGSQVAQTGVERPTSRDVTLYLHVATSIAALPPGVAEAGIRINRHQVEDFRNLVLLDTPDIDSLDAHHHAITLAWLKSINLILYVVSPERYRDHRGWSLLKKHAEQHGWIFCFNHWDQADPQQWTDFQAIVADAGFGNPLLFKTQANNPDNAQDDFSSLRDTLLTMANQQLAVHLEAAIADKQRSAEHAWLKQWLSALQTCSVSRTAGDWLPLWHETAATLTQGLQWQLNRCAVSYVSGDLKAQGASGLWDEWAQLQVRNVLGILQQQLSGNGLPTAVIHVEFEGLLQQTPEIVYSHIERCLRNALAKPGTRSQRIAYRFTGILAILLPLIASSWVAWEVASHYYLSSQTHHAWLTSDFALHSTLLILIAWLPAWLLHKLLQPSTEQTAQRALQHGLQQGLIAIESELASKLERVDQRLKHIETQAMVYLDVLHDRHAIENSQDPWLNRVCMDPVHTKVLG